MAPRGKFRSERVSGLRRRVVNLKTELDGLTANARKRMLDDAVVAMDSKLAASHSGAWLKEWPSLPMGSDGQGVGF